MNDNQEILNMSDLYVYDEDDLPGSTYPIRYRGIAKAQKNDAKLQKNLVSQKDYTLDTFLGGNQNHSLICQNVKICLTIELQKKTVDWYHDMICHPGETRTEHTISQHLD